MRLLGLSASEAEMSSHKINLHSECLLHFVHAARMHFHLLPQASTVSKAFLTKQMLTPFRRGRATYTSKECFSNQSSCREASVEIPTMQCIDQPILPPDPHRSKMMHKLLKRMPRSLMAPLQFTHCDGPTSMLPMSCMRTPSLQPSVACKKFLIAF